MRDSVRAREWVRGCSIEVRHSLKAGARQGGVRGL